MPNTTASRRFNEVSSRCGIRTHARSVGHASPESGGLLRVDCRRAHGWGSWLARSCAPATRGLSTWAWTAHPGGNRCDSAGAMRTTGSALFTSELPARSSAPGLPFCVCLLGLLLAACGGSSPTAPGPDLPGGLTVVAPTVGISEVSVKDRTVSFTWNAAPGATGFVLEIGRTPGGTQVDVITLEGAVTSYRASDMPAGISFARVRVKDASTTSAAGPELRFLVPDFREIVEALFFQTGPHAVPSGVSVRSVMLGWPQGTVLETRVWGLADEQHGDIERSLQQVEEATNGSIRGTVAGKLSDEAAFRDTPVNGELQVIVAPGLFFYCHAFNVLGCAALPDSNGVIFAARAVASSANFMVLMHEIGHAILGLHHIKLGPGSPGETWPGLAQPLMSPGFAVLPVLTPLELEAVQTVYAAGLRGGAHRSAFYAAGLIRNP
jgi:hypothetical protein